LKLLTHAEKRSRKQVGMKSLKDVFGQLIILESTVKELRQEVTRDVLIDCPRLVALALQGLENQISKIAKSVQDGISDAA